MLLFSIFRASKLYKIETLFLFHFFRVYISKLLILAPFLFTPHSINAQEKKYHIKTVAFYNFENLFDTINNFNNDDEWLPNGKQQWDTKKYKQKLKNLSRVLDQIGKNDLQKDPPTLIGCCEIENRGVLQDLIKEPNLIDHEYGIIHIDSQDKRGIDVGFLYLKKYFKPISFSAIPLHVFDSNTSQKTKEEEENEDENQDQKTIKHKRIYTRDILLITGFLDGEEINILVNHWPSRAGGQKKSSPHREAAGRLNRKIMDSIYNINPEAKIISMGDFNDGTTSKSIKTGIGAKLKKTEVSKFGVYNPFEQMEKQGNATIFYQDTGSIFDQILVSHSLIKNDYSGYQYWKSGIYNKPFLIQSTGRYKGYPIRNSANEVGFSDHFPVYIYLIKEMK